MYPDVHQMLDLGNASGRPLDDVIAEIRMTHGDAAADVVYFVHYGVWPEREDNEDMS